MEQDLLFRRGAERSLGTPCEGAKGVESCGRETMARPLGGGAWCRTPSFKRDRLSQPRHEKGVDARTCAQTTAWTRARVSVRESVRE